VCYSQITSHTLTNTFNDRFRNEHKLLAGDGLKALQYVVYSLVLVVSEALAVTSQHQGQIRQRQSDPTNSEYRRR